MILQINDISLAYGDKSVLEHFSLTVDRGEMVCISGESGCGKSSILNAIMGFVPIASGHIIINDIELSSSTIDRIRQQVAWLPQELSLPTEWVKEMVALPFELKVNRHLKYSEKQLLENFDRLGLEHSLFEKRVSEISGGQRQRIMVAVSALLDKSLIVGDEPTSALDAHSANKVIQFFKQQAQLGKAVLVVSHDSQVATLADKHIKL